MSKLLEFKGKTVGRRVAYVSSIRLGETYPLTGRIGRERDACWNMDGSWIGPSSPYRNDLDLASFPPSLKRTMKLAIDLAFRTAKRRRK